MTTDTQKHLKVYLVGGAVRDALLGRTIHDKDFVVVGGAACTLLAQGFSQVGADFPVFLHPITHHEYALARLERKSGLGHQGFSIDTANVSLEEDLARRDLTINAMAMPVAGLFDDTPTGDIIDPYDGQSDLAHRLLRHISPAFAEDPLRVLRVARFYARFYELGFVVADDTKTLIKNIADDGELSYLSRERIWAESVKALGEIHGFAYFKLLFELDILGHILPELSDVWHDDDLRQSTFMALKRAHLQPLTVKFALLISGFARQANGLTLLHDTCKRLLTPKAIEQFASLFISHFARLTRLKDIDAAELLQLIESTKAHKDSRVLFELTDAIAIITDTPIDHDLLHQAISLYQSVSIHDVDTRLIGKQIGDELTRLRLIKLNSLTQSDQA